MKFIDRTAKRLNQITPNDGRPYRDVDVRIYLQFARGYEMEFYARNTHIRFLGWRQVI